jgi:stress-induced morphogen
LARGLLGAKDFLNLRDTGRLIDLKLMKAAHRKIVIRLGFLLFGLVISLVFAEMICRIWLKHSDSSNGSRRVTFEEAASSGAVYHKPNSSFVYQGQVGAIKEFTVAGRWNSHGFNDEDHTFENPGHNFRIVIVGDSFVEALQVASERSFYRILENQLNSRTHGRKFEVIALGRSGAGARRNYQLLKELGFKYHPDLVLMEFLPSNDVVDDNVALQVLRRRQIEKYRSFSPNVYLPAVYRYAENSVFRHLKLVQITGQSIVNLRFTASKRTLQDAEQIPVEYFQYAETYDDLWRNGWEMTMNHIKMGKELSAANESQYVLMYFDEGFKLAGDNYKDLFRTYPAMREYKWDFDHPVKILSQFSTANNIRFVNLESAFVEEFRKNSTPLHYKYDGHWNEDGHKLAALKIFEYLAASALVDID